MKKIHFFMFAAVLFFALAADSKEKSYVVDLYSYQDFGPFSRQQFIVWPSNDSLIYKNVPKEIDEFVVRNISLLEQQILILIGTKNNKRVIIVDSDNDKDFGNEEILEYEYPISIEKYQEIQDSLPTISTRLEYLENGQLLTKNVNLKPSPYEGSLILTFNTENETEKKYLLFVSFPEHKRGAIHLNNSDLTVFVSSGSRALHYLKSYASVFIEHKSSNIDDFRKNIPYKIGDVFNVNGNDYLIDSVSKWGNELFIEYIGKNERPTGVSEGYYLPDFHATYLDNTDFDIKKYSGKYILLDFWGTWCNPCIKLIPELKELHSEFSDKNFVMISVAYDRNPETVMDFVVAENMNWQHLFVDINEYNYKSIINRLKITSYPTTILISPENKIIGRNLKIDDIRELLLYLDFKKKSE